MRILLAASEVAPIIKLGGLGDVIGSLPKALEKIGIDVDVIVPFYPSAKVEKMKLLEYLDLQVPFDNFSNLVKVYKTKLPDSYVDVYLLKNDNFFNLGGKSAFLKSVSETKMYSFFDKAVVEFVKASFNTYDIVHGNDWHTGLISLLLTDELHDARPKTLYTIHNMFYQGESHYDILEKIGIVPGTHRSVDYDIVDGTLNMMYQGLVSYDYLSTVSPTYAKECKTTEFGGNFSDILLNREGRFIGILNGIDYSYFETSITKNNLSEKKSVIKRKLLNELYKNAEPKYPLYIFVSRLDPGQKGLDILYQSMNWFSKNKAYFALLGSGDIYWENKFNDLLKDPVLKDKICINLKFDISMADNLYEAGDFLLIPSKYEPCGLTQMIAMHHATIPIARATGGLKDSIKHRNTGLLFKEYSSEGLKQVLDESLLIYNDPSLFNEIRLNCLREDFSWDKSALEYKMLYERIISNG